jgi:hypothetical protein
MAALRVILFTALAFGFINVKPGLFPPRDFVEYWSAAKVLADGGNPYDGSQLLVVQKAVDPEVKDKAVSLWTPPWTLPLYLPFGFLSFAVAHKVWLIVQLVCMGMAVEMLCRSLRFASRLNHLAFALFSPVFWNLHFGQNTAFILLGLAGFLRFRDSRPLIAGMFVALTAIKPHLLAPFGVLLIAEAIRPAGRKVLISGIGILIVGSVIAIAFDPGIFAEFAEAVLKPSTPETVGLRDWQVPLASYHLRQAVNPHWFWVQFLPCLTACLAASAWYAYRWKNWDWNDELPRIVVISMLAAPYGAWIFDLTLLLVPLNAGATMVLRSNAFLWKIVFFAGMLIVSACGLMIGSLQAAWWFTPAFAVVYLLAEISGRKESSCRGTIAS